jgi:hypothetical protein
VRAVTMLLADTGGMHTGPSASQQGDHRPQRWQPISLAQRESFRFSERESESFSFSITVGIAKRLKERFAVSIEIR